MDSGCLVCFLITTEMFCLVLDRRGLGVIHTSPATGTKIIHFITYLFFIQNPTFAKYPKRLVSINVKFDLNTKQLKNLLK